MWPEHRDQAYLWDMLQAANEARELCHGITFEILVRDRRTLLALERLMVLLGEAARRVSEEFQRGHAEVPWRKIIGLRNVLAHEYGSIDHRRLFLAAAEETLALSQRLEALLGAA
ncbi:MAG: DUF86 domain-containing protein [Betaproteobacteria bacterium]|nr:MAG: DUF86 domain-containing protein [Betaproteobacteria bacterium]